MICLGVAAWRRTALTALAAAGLIASPSMAQVILDTSFSADEGVNGYNSGSIQFQQPFGPASEGNGIWLGQAPLIVDEVPVTPVVDAEAGVVRAIGGTGAQGGGNFRRNTWSLGANGGNLGGDGSGEINNGGFTEGDRAIIEIEYQITRGPDPNTTLFQVGLKDNFVNAGFEANPYTGIEVAYSDFEAGELRVFTNFDRAGFIGADAAFALAVPSASIGLDNGFEGGPIDLESDNLLFRYEVELTDEAADLWTPTDVIVTNLDTATVVAQASVDNPAALETFVWNSTAEDDPFTDDVDEGGVAMGDGSDFFLGISWLTQATTEDIAEIGGLRFEFIPNVPGDYNNDGLVNAADYTVWRDNLGSTENLEADGDGNGVIDIADYNFWVSNFGGPTPPALSVVPEPTALFLVALTAASAGFRRRR